MKNQIIITLGREHGSGGHYIADMIAQELGIKLYDKDSIEKEIVSEGYSEEMIRKMDEKPVNFFASRRIGKYSNSLEVNVAEKTFAMLLLLRDEVGRRPRLRHDRQERCARLRGHGENADRLYPQLHGAGLNKNLRPVPQKTFEMLETI